LYFSCKNYQEIARARITKVVGYFTTNPTKLVLHFLRFFYNFLRNLQETGKSLYYWSYSFAGRPSKIKVALQCSPWGRPAGAAGAIPARLVTGLAGEGLGKGTRVARGWFGSAMGAELAGGEMSGGAQWR
jgi:hypothetical protein